MEKHWTDYCSLVIGLQTNDPREVIKTLKSYIMELEKDNYLKPMAYLTVKYDMSPVQIGVAKYTYKEF